MFRVGELRELLESVGLPIECLSASDCLSVGWAEDLSTLGEKSEAWRHLIEMEIEACRESGCAGMGSHIIAVARRTQSGGRGRPVSNPDHLLRSRDPC